MQFIIMNYCHCHQSAIIVIRVPSSSSKMLSSSSKMLSSSSECYHRYHRNAIIVIIEMLSSLSSKCYHRYHQNAIIVIIKMLSSSSSKCYHRHQNCYHRQWRWCRLLQGLLSSSMEVVPSSSEIAIVVNGGDAVAIANISMSFSW